MKFSRNKVEVTAVIFVLVLTIAISLITFLPTTNAAVTKYTSYVYCSVGNSLIGVGQQVLIVMWTADMPPDIGEIAGTAPGGRAAWYDVGFYVTDPEGNTETITIAKTDPVGGGWVNYTPDKIGTYTVQSWFPETWKNTTTNQAHYSAAVSPEVTFTVQEEPISGWPESPVTDDYWNRPINQASRDWYVLAGNWLGGQFNKYPAGASGGTTNRFVWGKGTESAHILWTKPYYVGGIMDAYYGQKGYQTGHYQGLDFEAIIINGKMYYNYRTDAHMTEGYLCVDLYTGETLWYRNDTRPALGQIYDYESPNQHGGYAYLWKQPPFSFFGPPSAEPPVWEMIDAYTGRSICKVVNVTMGISFFGMSFGGFPVYGKDGSLLNYAIENLAPFGSPEPDYYLQVWNMSAVDTMIAGTSTETTAWQWRPSGGGFGGGPPLGYYVHDGSTGFSLNVSIATADVYGPRNALLNETGSIRCVREGEYIIVGTQGRNDERGVVQGKMTALSLERGKEGTKLWDTTFTPPFASIYANLTGGFFGGGFGITGVYPEDGVILFESGKQLKRWGYSLETGELLWESEPEAQSNYYTMISNVYDGKLLTAGYGGVLLAYNITTGEIVWSYEATNVGFESPYGNYPLNIFAICDGKIYTLTGEHSITQPMWRGPNLRCINATTGEEIWKILGFSANGGAHLTGQYAQMADGYVIALNFFDNEIYCFGRGPSATTVEAPMTAIPLGERVVIRGTVTDDTPTGRRNTNDMFEFTLQGTPAISDEDMGAWMEYMFMQQAKPKDVKGVEVVITTLDPNGNTYELGRITSDENGEFGCVVDPPVPGKYKIIATFEGSAAYGPSSASTYLWVEEAPSPAVPIEPEAPEEPTEEPTAPEEPTEPTAPEEPTEPEEPEEPTEPEPTEPTEAPFITTEVAIIVAVAVVAVIGIVAYWVLKKRK